MKQKKGSKTAEKMVTRNTIKQLWVFLVTLPDGKRYVDSSSTKTPKEKLYWYYMQVRNGKESTFYNEIRKQCGNYTEGLELRILEFSQTNCDQIGQQWLKAKVDEWIDRLETDNETKGGLNC